MAAPTEAGAHAHYALRSSKALSLDKVVYVLKHSDEYSVVNSIPVDLQSGDVYLFIPSRTENQDDWKKDPYTWVNCGPKAIPSNSPVVSKRYFSAKLPGGRVSKFQKHSYSLYNDERELKPILIHYFGETEGVVLKRNKKNVKEKTVDEPSPIAEETQVARDESLKELANVQRERALRQRKVKITKENFQKLHDIAYNLEGFVKQVVLVPEFYCIFGLESLSEEVERILESDTNTNLTIFSYSKTYKLGDFYLTPLLFTYYPFEGRPVIPTHFVLHEDNAFKAHTDFAKILAAMIPSLKNKDAYVITEFDQCKIDGLNKTFPSLQHLSSWKLILNSTKEWLYKKGAMQQEVMSGLEDLRNLFSQTTLERYEDMLTKYKENWTELFLEYYMTNVNPQVVTKLGRWILEEQGVYNPYTGVTDRGNDYLELVLAELKDWVNVPPHSVLLCCFLIQKYIWKDMLRGYCLQGGFALRQEFPWLRRQVDDSKLFTSTYGPRDVVSFIKLGHISVKNGVIEENVAFDPKQILLAKAKRILDIGGVQMQPLNQGFLVKDPETEVPTFNANQSQVLGQPQNQTANTTNSLLSVNQSHTVKLFPRPSCSCSYMGLCGHIIAAKISIGIDMDSEMEKLNDEFVSRSLKSEEAGPNKKRRKRKRKVKTEEDEDGVPSAQVEMSIHTNGESVDMDIEVPDGHPEQTAVLYLETTGGVVPDAIFQ